MKNKFLFVFLASVCFATIALAQELTFRKYTWEANPTLLLKAPLDAESNYNKLKQKIILDYVYESSGELVMYETIHEIIHLNNEKGIEEMNKIYIPASKILEEIDLKARTITPEGKVIPINKSFIKHVDNLEDNGPYIIFAMEGAEKGCEIEYIYTNKKTPSLNSYWKVQDERMRKNMNIDIYTPENLIFEAKGYNGFPEFKSDTVINKRNHIYANVDVIPALFDEKYSAYEANRMRFEYQLGVNKFKGKGRIYTWETIGADIYNSLYNSSKQEIKSVEKLITKLKIDKIKSDEEKIAAIESWMKSNIGVKEDGNIKSIDKMLDLKYGTEYYFQKFYVCAAQLLTIPVEAVVTCNRMKRKFDPDFQSYNSLQDYLLYFPTIDKYIVVDDYSSRIGFPSPDLTGHKGMFVRETVIGDLKTGLTKIKSIEPTNVKYSHNDIFAAIEFEDGTMTPKMQYKHSFVGYSAYYTQPELPYLDDEGRKQFLDNMAKHTGKETIVKSVKMTGNQNNDVLKVPLVIESVIETPHLVENAGNKMLFKIGEVIGMQEELYQEKPRQTNGEIAYAHSFERKMEIKIPAGYKITNLKDLNFDMKYYIGDKPVSVFVSSYTIENNVVKLTVYEDYQVLWYPQKEYDQWKKIINAAADFNKVVLIFEKI
jgi:hypothetical protein